MSEPAPTRTLRVLTHLVATPGGGTVPELITAVDPECSQNAMAAMLHSLLTRNKVSRTREPGMYRYFATATALVDLRQGPRKEAKPAKRASKPQPKPKAPPPARQAAPPKRPPTRVPPVVLPPSLHRHQRPTGPLSAEQVAADVAAFLAQGGAIERLPTITRPLPTSSAVAINDPAWFTRPALAFAK